MIRKYLLPMTVLTVLFLYSAFAGSISGTVTSSGNPVQGATVNAVKVPFDSTFISAVSDSAGNYVLDNVPVGQYKLRCRFHEIVVEDSVLVTIQGDSSVVVNFELPQVPQLHNSIAGKITNRNTNEPIVGATARLYGPNSSFLTAPSDSQGQFSFTNIPVGRYTLSAVAVGFNGATNQHDMFVDNNTQLNGLNITLEPVVNYHTAISGFVYDSVSGLPIAGALIFNGIVTIRFDSLHPNFVFSDSSGFFIFSNVGPMTYHLTCSASGYKESHSTAVVVTSETTTVNFYLQPLSTGILSGKVTLTDGTPIPGARLEFIPIQWGIGGGSKYATTDSTGAYSATLLIGEYYVWCEAEVGGVHFAAYYGYNGGQVNVLANQTTSGIDFAFQLPRQIHITVSGIVTDRSGNPLEGALVSAGFDSMMRCSAPGQLGTTQTGADGHYALALTISAREQLRFALSARHKGYEVQYYNDKSVPWLADFFTVNSDTAIADINFALDTTIVPNNSISGTVTSSAGQPILNGFVFALGKLTHDPHMAQTDSAGNYTLSNLYDEEYYVAFAAMGFLSEIYDNVHTWEQATAVLANGAVTGIDAILDSAKSDSGHGRIIGRIHDHNGNPLAGVLLTLLHGQNIAGSAMTLSDGTYDLENVGTGQYSVIGSKAGYASSTETISITTNSAATSAINLDLTYQASSTAISVGSGWNLVSIPMHVSDGKAASVLPGYSGSLYRYSSTGYAASGQLSHGTGYWMKNSSTGSFDISGDAVTAETVAVAQGWNMIGALSLPVAVSSIMSTQQGFVTSQFFGFKDSYVAADTLYPGKGYWVKVNSAGTLVISLNSSSSTLHSITVARSTEAPPASPSGSKTTELKPSQYALEQNYPNPFNPATTIKYQLPADSKVVITIYNVIGQVVGNLVNGVETAGYKEITWNAGNAASGLYFCRINATSVDDPVKSYTQVKKMMLLR